MKFLTALLLLTSVAVAGNNDKTHLPKSFSVSGGRAVFADFSEAVYNITYDVAARRASVVADIRLQTMEAGFPVFDSVTAPIAVSIDGVAVQTVQSLTPENETILRYVNQLTPAGVHILRVEVPLTALVDFTPDGGVKSAFWTSDLSERQFLERYLPANFEFDQVQMTFNVNFIGAKTKQVIYTNGVMGETRLNSFRIVYPPYYTASSIFFHAVPQGATNELRFTLRSIDGRIIPAVVYAGKSSFGVNLENLKARTTAVFQELESDYGPFPHPTLTVLQAGMGGMEYCGATMTEMRALGHELFHSYFARGVMPANGNAGWLDEALASWRDAGYQSSSALSGSSNMSAHPYYTRITDRNAYTFGEQFMRYLDGKLKAKGGLKPFMRYMVERRVFSPLFVEEFIAEMNRFYGVSLDADFRKFTYGVNSFTPTTKKSKHSIHTKMTIEELQNYL